MGPRRENWKALAKKGVRHFVAEEVERHDYLSPRLDPHKGHDTRKGCHYYTRASGVLRRIVVTGLAPVMVFLPCHDLLTPLMFSHVRAALDRHP